MMATRARDVDARVIATDSAARETLRALERLLAPLTPRDFAVRLWTGDVLPPSPGQEARFVLDLTHPTSLVRMFWPPGELTIANAFVRGDWDVEGDLVAAVSLRDRVRPGPSELLALGRIAASHLRSSSPVALLHRAGAPFARAIRARAPHLHGAKHRPRRDAAAVRHHYDAGNDFYALWLDERMVYSCAYFADPQASLDEAQEAKLELVCRKLRLAPGERLLDIGCGWGALVTWAAEHHGVDAVGITLSAPQAALARERIAARGLSGRCRIDLADYRELRGERFDKIASVGMVEHVGLARLPTYFRRASELLRPGGLFLNHGIAPVVPRDRSLGSRLRHEGGFVDRYVFPDGELPFLHETAAAAVAAGLELRDVESLREHYALTLRHWVARLERRRPEAERVVGVAAYRTWRLYMAGAAADFERGQNTVFQALYVKSHGGRSGLPLTRGDLYATPILSRGPR
jgi:cyclopropane-fatty-acyl-phospholipid synthase